MDAPGFSDLLLVTAVAFAAPLAAGLARRVRLPSVVLEILAGILVGPSVLGWVAVDETIAVLSVVGLAFLLFLSGLELDVDRLGGPLLRLAATGWAASFALAVAAGAVLGATGLVQTPLLVAVVLCATSLGVIVPVLKDVGELGTAFGQLVLAAATIADFGAVVLLSVLFSGEGGAGSTALLLGVFGALLAAAFAAVRGAGRSRVLADDLARLSGTSVEIRVRGAVLLLVAFAAVAEAFGLEVILGAFGAGGLLALLDRRGSMSHPDLRPKLEAIGYGLVIPVFFVASGITFDLGALLDEPAGLAMVPAFLAALLVVRGLPALLYRPLLDARRATVAGILQATSLPFVVAATAIGRELGLMSAAEASALVAAGLLSVLLFPVAGLALLRRRAAGVTAEPVAETSPA